MTRRSFDINAINAGRTRRDASGQPSRFDARRDSNGRGSLYAELTRELDEIASRFDDITRRQAEPVRERHREPARPAPRRDDSHGMARDDGFGLVGQGIADLKSDIRNQLRNELDGQYRRLRSDLEKLEDALSGTGLGDTFRSDLGELYRALEAVAEGNRDVREGQAEIADTLHRELAGLRDQFRGLASDEGLSRLSSRFDDMESRWSRVESRMASGIPSGLADDITGIADRLDHMQAQLQRLPDHSALPGLEAKIAQLVDGLDRIATGNRSSSADFSRLDDRFDEISMAIAALQQDGDSHLPQAIERIEHRIAALGERLDAAARGTSPEIAATLDRFGERLSALGEFGAQDALVSRMDGLAAMLEQAVKSRQIGASDFDALTRHFKAIAERIDDAVSGNGAAAGLPELADHLDSRFEALEARLAAVSAPPPASRDEERLARMLEDRLAALDDQMAGLRDSMAMRPAGEQGDGALLDHLDARFRQVERQIADMRNIPAASAGSLDVDGLAERIESRIAELGSALAMPTATTSVASMDALENRLDQIARHLDEASASGDDSAALARLEDRISDLARHLSAGAAPAGVDMSDLADRFQMLEERIAGQRSDMLDVAREAAEAALSRIAARDGASGGETVQFVERLAQDIADLEQLTRQSNERNSGTFNAIHDTLLKIVDRIGTLENRGPSMPAQPARAMAAPSVAPEADAFDEPEAGIDLDGDEEPALVAAPAPQARKAKQARGEKLSPSEAAQAAARAALEDLDDDMPHGDFDADLADATADGDAPLPPGTAIPDLQTILKRVRDKKKASPMVADGGGSEKDRFASIMRAAQAAANEAQTVTKKSKSLADGKGGKLKDIYGKFRRPILFAAAAAVIAIAALQLGSAFLGTDPEVETAVQTGPAATEPASPVVPLQESGAALPLTTTPQTDVAAADVRDATPNTETSEAASALPAATPAATPDTPVVAEAPAADAGEAALPALPQGFGPLALAEAAKGGDALALFEVGRRMSEDGNGADAVNWFKASAEAGFAPAQYRLGNIYEKGLGTGRDAAEAKVWYQMAAEQGNASAMHNLAVLHATGATGTADADSAGRWFVEAADLGVKDSQFNLGILYAKGQGVPQDLEESYKWFAIVAKAGDQDAASKRDEVAKALRPEQLQSARGKADLWRPKPLDDAANVVDVPEDWRIASTTTASVDMKKAITNVQLILAKSGYDAGTPDGVMGAKTRNAIKAFQKDNGMPQTGEVDEALVRALLAKAGATPNG